MRHKFIFYVRCTSVYLLMSAIIYAAIGELGAIVQTFALAILLGAIIKTFSDRPLFGTTVPEVVPDQTEQELDMVAHHEAGHAVVGWLLPGAYKPDHATIIRNANADGEVRVKPSRDHKDLEAAIDVIAFMFAGTVAVQEFGGTHNAGASHDLWTASTLAQEMVCDWGFSDKLPRRYYDLESDLLTGDILTTINAEIDRFLKLGEERAIKTVKAHRQTIARVAARLLKEKKLDEAGLRETIEAVQAA